MDSIVFLAVSRLRKTANIAWRVISALCTLYVCWILLETFVIQRTCDQPGSYSLVTNDPIDDRKVKATVFTTDCGAMTSTRTMVNFSNAFVNGRTRGETVVVLTGVGCSHVRSAWATNREFVVAYPRTAAVEFAVAKIRGVSISLQPE